MSHGLSREIQKRTLALIRNLIASRFARAANPADDAGEFDEWALAPNESIRRSDDDWEDGAETWFAPAPDE